MITANRQHGGEHSQPIPAPRSEAKPDVFMLIVRALCDQEPVGEFLALQLEQTFRQLGAPFQSVVVSTSDELRLTLSQLPRATCIWATIIGHGNQNGLGFTKGELKDWQDVAAMLAQFHTQSLCLASCRAGRYRLKMIFDMLPDLRVITASPIKMSPDSEVALGLELTLIVKREDSVKQEFLNLNWDDLERERDRRKELAATPAFQKAARTAILRWSRIFLDPESRVSTLADRLAIEEPEFAALLPDNQSLGRELLVSIPFTILLNPGFLIYRSLELVAESVRWKRHLQTAFEMSRCSNEVKEMAARISKIHSSG